MTLLEYLDTLRRHWRIVFSLGVVGAALGFALASQQPNVYRASATVLVSTDRAGSASDLVQGSTYVENLVTSYAVMATSELVLDTVVDDLGLDMPVKALAGSVTAEAPLNTVLINIYATRESPAEAQQIANAVADSLAEAVSQVSPAIEGRPAIRVTTIQPAALPVNPIAPNKLRMSAAGGLFGAGLGVGIALLLRAFGGRVNGASDVAGISTTPVVGEVVEAQRRTTLPGAVLEDPRSAEAESLRSLAANLHYLNFDGGLKSFLVTSASPAEAKSSVASAMALILAETSSRVLLVDADLRSPSIQDFTGLDNSIGLSTVLIGDFELERAVQQWGRRGVDVLTSGPVPPNPGQLLNSEAIRQLLAEASEQYDVVVVDTGPMSLVSDAVWLGHLVDGVLVVARRGKTRTRMLRRVLETLASARTPASGVVITWAKRRRSTYARGYGGYGSGSTAMNAPRWKLAVQALKSPASKSRAKPSEPRSHR